MPSLANLPVEIWDRIIDDAAGPIYPISNTDVPWIHSPRSESLLRATRKRRLCRLQLFSGVARTWRELCVTLSYETFLIEGGNPTPLGRLLNTQLAQFPSLFRRVRRLVVHFPCPGLSFIHESIDPFVILIGKMPALQDLAVHVSPFRSKHEYRLLEEGIMEALRLIGHRLLFLQIQEPMDQDLSHGCVLTHRNIGTLSALAPNLTRLICAVEVDEPCLSDPAPNFPSLQILHMQLHADRQKQASAHNWIQRWRLGALKQFCIGYHADPSTWEWITMLLAGNNGRNLEVFGVATNVAPLHINPALWTQCSHLHTIISPGLRWFRLALPPTHRPLKALIYKGSVRMDLRQTLSQKHLFSELRDIDFAAHTIIRLLELSWEEILGSGVEHAITITYPSICAGIAAGLRFVDANGEALDEFFVRTGGAGCTLT